MQVKGMYIVVYIIDKTYVYSHMVQIQYISLNRCCNINIIQCIYIKWSLYIYHPDSIFIAQKYIKHNTSTVILCRKCVPFITMNDKHSRSVNTIRQYIPLLHAIAFVWNGGLPLIPLLHIWASR